VLILELILKLILSASVPATILTVLAGSHTRLRPDWDAASSGAWYPVRIAGEAVKDYPEKIAALLRREWPDAIAGSLKSYALRTEETPDIARQRVR
jgi:hypothetical protein